MTDRILPIAKRMAESPPLEKKYTHRFSWIPFIFHVREDNEDSKETYVAIGIRLFWSKKFRYVDWR